ncbi:ABC transporter ATP-binding protein [Pannonibacter sp. Pt2-lr]
MLRGGEIGMVFQEPMTALSPVHTIGTQIMRTVMLHKKVSKAEARNQAIELLKRVQMPRPADIVDRYPHHLSGGMRQRAMIALALACDPALLIADEPTTALDVTTEAQILELLKQLQEELNMAIVFITHNFGVVADIADRVAVMYLGRVVETGTVDEIFYEPKHPYTQALLQSIPRLGKSHGRRLRTISGMVPDPYNVPGGCSFHPRCMHGVAGVCDVVCRRMPSSPAASAPAAISPELPALRRLPNDRRSGFHHGREHPHLRQGRAEVFPRLRRLVPPRGRGGEGGG